MLVSELKDLLAAMPETARVVVVIRRNTPIDAAIHGVLRAPREADVLGVNSVHAEVLIRLEE